MIIYKLNVFGICFVAAIIKQWDIRTSIMVMQLVAGFKCSQVSCQPYFRQVKKLPCSVC